MLSPSTLKKLARMGELAEQIVANHEEFQGLAREVAGTPNGEVAKTTRPVRRSTKRTKKSGPRPRKPAQNDVVLTLMATEDRVWSTAELVERIGQTPTILGSTLSKLCKAGRVIRVGRGQYRSKTKPQASGAPPDPDPEPPRPLEPRALATCQPSGQTSRATETTGRPSNGVRSSLPPGYPVPPRLPPSPSPVSRSTLGAVPLYGTDDQHSVYLGHKKTKPLPRKELDALFAELAEIRSQWWTEVVSSQAVAPSVIAFVAAHQRCEIPQEVSAAIPFLSKGGPGRETAVAWLSRSGGWRPLVWDGLSAKIRGDDVEWLPARHLGSAYEAWFGRCSRIMARYDELRRRIGIVNLRLVMQYAGRLRGRGAYSFADLVSEGFFGLLTAIDRFDLARGFRFSTYATNWVRHSINRALENRGRVVRIPNGLQGQRAKVDAARAIVGDDIEALALHTGISVVGVRNVALYAGVMAVHASLDHPAGPNDDAPDRKGLIADEGPTADLLLMDHEVDGRLAEAIGTLPPREQGILARRFGLTGEDPETLAFIGADLDLSRERIRQLEHGALLELKRILRDSSGTALTDEPQERVAAFLNSSKNPVLLSEVSLAAVLTPGSARKILYAMFADGLVCRSKHRYVGVLDHDQVDARVLAVIAKDDRATGTDLRRESGLHTEVIAHAIERLIESRQIFHQGRTYYTAAAAPARIAAAS